MSFHPNDVVRRAGVARMVLVGAFAVLAGAFFRTQVLQNAQYVLQSEENRLRGWRCRGSPSAWETGLTRSRPWS